LNHADLHGVQQPARSTIHDRHSIAGLDDIGDDRLAIPQDEIA